MSLAHMYLDVALEGGLTDQANSLPQMEHNLQQLQHIADALHGLQHTEQDIPPGEISTGNPPPLLDKASLFRPCPAKLRQAFPL